MRFGAYLTGAFGQSDALYRARNELGKRGSSADAFEAQLLSDTKKVIELQQAAGLSYVIDPMFRWFSIFYPLIKGVRNAREGPQNPWAKNLFYNWPIIDGPLSHDDAGFIEKFLYLDLLPKGKAAAVLPSPYTVLMASDVKGYRDQRSALLDLAQLFREESKRLVEKGVVRILYEEPVIALKQSRGSIQRDDFTLLRVAMEYCGHIEGATTSLQISLGTIGDQGDKETLIPFLRDLPVDCVGIDGTRTSIDEIARHRFDGKELAIGLLDARSASMEDPGNLATKLRRVMEEARPSRLFLTPDTSTEYIGWTLATQKLDIMKRTLQELAENE